jgi:IclR family transcriptional regulator, KDG regulon repressor
MSVKSARRVIELLEIFDSAQEPITFGRLVAATGWPTSSLAALLTTLGELGYIHHDPQARSYVPTAKVAHLGEWIQDTAAAVEPALLTLLNRLNESCGETVVLAEQRGLYVRFVNVLLNRQRPIATHTRSGLLRPICSYATGWCLLSVQSDAEIGRIVRDFNRTENSNATSVRLQDVKARVSEVRRYGFVVSRHSVMEGIGVVAMPLGYPSRGRRFAVGIGAPIARLDRRLSTLVVELRQCVSAWNKLVIGLDD